MRRSIIRLGSLAPPHGCAGTGLHCCLWQRPWLANCRARRRAAAAAFTAACRSSAAASLPSTPPPSRGCAALQRERERGWLPAAAWQGAAAPPSVGVAGCPLHQITRLQHVQVRGAKAGRQDVKQAAGVVAVGVDRCIKCVRGSAMQGGWGRGRQLQASVVAFHWRTA